MRSPGRSVPLVNWRQASNFIWLEAVLLTWLLFQSESTIQLLQLPTMTQSKRNQIPEIHYDSPRSAPLGLVPGRWRSPSPGERSLPKLLSTRTSPVGVDSSNVVLGTSLLYIDINSLYIMSMGVGGLHTWDRELLWMRCRNLMHRQPRTCFLFDRTTRFMSDRSRGVDCCIPATSVTTVVMAQNEEIDCYLYTTERYLSIIVLTTLLCPRLSIRVYIARLDNSS